MAQSLVYCLCLCKFYALFKSLKCFFFCMDTRTSVHIKIPKIFFEFLKKILSKISQIYLYLFCPNKRKSNDITKRFHTK